MEWSKALKTESLDQPQSRATPSDQSLVDSSPLKGRPTLTAEALWSAHDPPPVNTSPQRGGEADPDLSYGFNRFEPFLPPPSVRMTAFPPSTPSNPDCSTEQKSAPLSRQASMSLHSACIARRTVSSELRIATGLFHSNTRPRERPLPRTLRSKTRPPKQHPGLVVYSSNRQK